MILTSICYSKAEMLGVHILILISLLIISLWVEKLLLKLPALVTPLVLVLVGIFIAAIIHPFMPWLTLSDLRFWYVDAVLLIFPLLAVFGIRAIVRQKECQRSSWFFGALGILPMFFAFYHIYGVILQVAFASLVLRHCLRFGPTDFKIQMIRNCIRLILLAMITSWLIEAWDVYQGLATMTGAGKGAMMIVSYSTLFAYIALEFFLLLPLLLWLLRQDRLRPHEAPQAQECRSSL